MSSAAVHLAGLTKAFGATLAVDAVDLEVRQGGFLALLGPSGCGKSTTLRLIAGFEVPDSGTVAVGGQVVAGPRVMLAPERREVGMVFQEGALFPHLTVAANIGYGLRSGAGRSQRVAELLELIGLPGLELRMPHELSGGEQQRVALARALAPQPTVVLLDEPFSSLDAGLRARLRVDVRSILRRAGATAISVTHDQDEAFSLADEVAVMWRGRIVQRSTPEDLYTRPATREVAAFVGDANFLAGYASNGRVETELGMLAANGAAQGNVEAMLRPESVALRSDASSDLVVNDVEYFGHDRIISIRLASGEQLKSRVAGESALRPGDRVRVEIVGSVAVFPRSG